MFRSLRTLQILAVCWLGTPLLAGCEETTVRVNIQGVNYSGNTFTYFVSQPEAPEKSAGGGLIDPYGAGGVMCCFSLPQKWQPGIRVKVRTKHWLPKQPDGRLPEVKEEHVVEVPPYVDGKPGELWVLRGEDGSVSVISSDFQPDHSKWPGKVKGWPVPSIEYRRERWEILKKHQEDFVKAYLSLINALEKSPQTEAKDAWEHAKKFEPSSIENFLGPDDPRFIAFLRADYKKGLQESRDDLEKVMEQKP